MELAPLAYALLAGIERGIPTATIESELVACEPSDSSLQELLRTVLQLRAAGLFQLEELESDAERARSLKDYAEESPRKMMLLIHTSCNLKCTYCYEVQAGFHQRGGAMPLGTARLAVDRLIRVSGERKHLEITFFGGEPLLNLKGIKQVVEYARGAAAVAGKTVYFQMTTNGVLLNDDVREYLGTERIGVMVSMDGTPAQNDVHRVDHGGRGVGNLVLENVRALIAMQRAAGLRPAKIRATLTRQHSDRAAVAQFFEQEGFARTSIGGSMGRADRRDDWDLPWEMTEEQRERLDQAASAFLDAAVAGRSIPPSVSHLREAVSKVREALESPQRRARIHCGVGRNMLAFTGSGAIYPCHRYAGEDAFQLGTLDDGLDTARLKEFYSEVLSGYDDHCSRCWARNLCGGQCPWYVSRADGHVGTPDKPSCDALRRGFESHLGIYRELLERRSLAVCSPRDDGDTRASAIRSDLVKTPSDSGND